MEQEVFVSKFKDLRRICDEAIQETKDKTIQLAYSLSRVEGGTDSDILWVLDPGLLGTVLDNPLERMEGAITCALCSGLGEDGKFYQGFVHVLWEEEGLGSYVMLVREWEGHCEAYTPDGWEEQQVDEDKGKEDLLRAVELVKEKGRTMAELLEVYRSSTVEAVNALYLKRVLLQMGLQTLWQRFQTEGWVITDLEFLELPLKVFLLAPWREEEWESDIPFIRIDGVHQILYASFRFQRLSSEEVLLHLTILEKREEGFLVVAHEERPLLL